MSNINSSNLKPQELNSSTSNVLQAPQVKGMISGTPMESAYLSGKQNNELVSSLSKVGGQRRIRRIKYKGGAGSVVVPTLPVSYNDQMVGPQSVTGQTVGNASSILQANANSQYDKVTLVKPPIQNKIGGRRKSRRRQKSRKSRKSKKSRKTRK
jgi:hypothetical protein